MLAEQIVALRHQLLEAREAGRCGYATSREQRQLEPALVGVVDRLEELLRIGGVDEHRKLEPRARVPDRIELGIVELEARAVRLLDRQAEALRDLADADRARGDVGLELRDRLLRPARSDVLEVDAGQHAHAVLHLSATR